MIEDKTQKLAARIALLLQDNERDADDLSFVRASLEKINQRLDKIESQISFQHPDLHSVSANFTSLHPSIQKFENLEDSTHLGNKSLENEKACPYEPNGKPCDHCAMCSSRGF